MGPKNSCLNNYSDDTPKHTNPYAKTGLGRLTIKTAHEQHQICVSDQVIRTKLPSLLVKSCGGVQETKRQVRDGCGFPGGSKQLAKQFWGWKSFPKPSLKWTETGILTEV